MSCTPFTLHLVSGGLQTSHMHTHQSACLKALPQCSKTLFPKRCFLLAVARMYFTSPQEGGQGDCMDSCPSTHRRYREKIVCLLYLNQVRCDVHMFVISEPPPIFAAPACPLNTSCTHLALLSKIMVRPTSPVSSVSQLPRRRTCPSAYPTSTIVDGRGTNRPCSRTPDVRVSSAAASLASESVAVRNTSTMKFPESKKGAAGVSQHKKADTYTSPSP